jgi:hypothetical protein
LRDFLSTLLVHRRIRLIHFHRRSQGGIQKPLRVAMLGCRAALGWIFGTRLRTSWKETMRRSYQTQWAGQFGVAHELVRRGYLVTFTTGNAPADDLLCLSPYGVAFSIQVKSLGSVNYFLFQESLLKPKPTRFFAFVLVPLACVKPPEYFIMNNEQFIRLEAEEKQRLRELEEKRGKPFAKFSPGIHYSTIAGHDFRNAWGNLPE